MMRGRNRTNLRDWRRRHNRWRYRQPVFIRLADREIPPENIARAVRGHRGAGKRARIVELADGGNYSLYSVADFGGDETQYRLACALQEMRGHRTWAQVEHDRRQAREQIARFQRLAAGGHKR